MCGRARCTVDPDSIARSTGARADRWTDRERYRPSYNVTPGHYTPVVRPQREKEGDSKERTVHVMKWGLVPSFTKKDEKPDHFRMFNARSESVREKASFRRLIPHSRCVAPFEGFFEWKKDGAKKQPYYIHLQGDEPIVFAALYDRWERADGDIMYSYTILTTRVSTRLEWLHDRMPVILRTEDDVRSWLDPDLPAEKLPHLTQPYEGPDLVWHAVTPAMGSPAFNGPECVEEVKTKAVGESPIAQLFRKQKAAAPVPELQAVSEPGAPAAACSPPVAAGKGSSDGRPGGGLSEEEEAKAFEAGLYPDRDVTADFQREHARASSPGDGAEDAGDGGGGGGRRGLTSPGSAVSDPAAEASCQLAAGSGGSLGHEAVVAPHDARLPLAEDRKRVLEGRETEAEDPPKKRRKEQAATKGNSKSPRAAATSKVHSPGRADKQKGIDAFFKRA